MFDTVLIANRGAIACRILRTLRRLGIRSVAVYSDADRHAAHVEQADAAIRIGPAPAADSYLRQDFLLEAARASGAQAIHPGYGFLSENADFAAATEAAGLVFVGPTPDQMRAFGLKHRARALAAECDVPLLPGSGLLDDLAAARHAAEMLGYPVMLKSTAGGGGIGMQLCRSEQELAEGYESVERLAAAHFGRGGLFVEKLIERARHIEVQIFGDGRGTVVALGERDCSIQRRNQKVIEETPAPGLSDTIRDGLADCALRLCRRVSYRSAGTVEFLYDIEREAFYFLEVNTRLQVEHGVTEAVTDIDLVEWMLHTAAGLPPELARHVHRPSGHAIQARLYAEDPGRSFRPSSGLLTALRLPDGARVDTWVVTGTEVTPHYDPLLAKIISHAPTRALAVERLEAALAATRAEGVETNLAYLRHILASEGFRAGCQSTRYLATLGWQPHAVEVLKPGTHTTVQDYPGRLGYWDVGVPPSGPMDDFAFRLANRVIGNDPGAAALEMTITGPTLHFVCEAVIALAGAAMTAELDGRPLDYWQQHSVPAGATLRLGRIHGGGQRTYLAVRGGIDVAEYMGSRSTFTLGQFGGHCGRALKSGDLLRLTTSANDLKGASPVPRALVPAYTQRWEIAVIYGPHGAPDFFTPDDICTFFAADWEVHYNSSRTGVRLIGPKPRWARADGGEAGLHPSNIHDNAYAVGTINYTGDMPVILGPDGPSLGGFVCPATVALTDLWKVGQLSPGDQVRFVCIRNDEAVARQAAQDKAIASLTPPLLRLKRLVVPDRDVSPILDYAGGPARVAVCYRQSGEDYVLIEYGSTVLDLELRFRVHALTEWLRARALPAIIDLTPGIRSLQVHYDCRQMRQSELLALLTRAEDELPGLDALVVPSRIVHLPLSWDDPATRLAIEKYTKSVRADAPWCPSNIEFIRRINGLATVDDVRRIVFEASYLVLGLGDVYLGAPVATPLDPRHRLVTTKYNPARTWTPENAVGIGGAYLCVYGMEGPGGYQFVGRTLQMWNRYRQTADFKDGQQWLLRFFDQIRFYPVGAAELLELRDQFEHGRFRLRIDAAELRLSDYRQFLAAHASSIAEFKAHQQTAFEAERERWRAAGQDIARPEPEEGPRHAAEDITLPAGCLAVSSPVTGSVWSVVVTAGQRVRAGQSLVVVEAMKMEVPIEADDDAEVVEIRCARGRAVTAGEALVVLKPHG